ncbi:beta-ketoacyl synthase N-terminal-like domain-containing protein [Streptomyces sp. FXJ1.172]|nr:beta-ketoacyl synthase N-terminal-like domain-containing protein [Streptomyces sp. FXJ1.172]WEO93365.1 beta-ketoacyl synthase N-terminal-like domain-containing protein [Streptomyces sp. FXJ1.172]
MPMVIPNMATGEVSIDLRAHGVSIAPATACASGATAIALARDLLAADLCDVAVAGGAETAISRTTVTGFWRMGALSERTAAVTEASRPFAADRDGFVMAEGLDGSTRFSEDEYVHLYRLTLSAVEQPKRRAPGVLFNAGAGLVVKAGAWL